MHGIVLVPLFFIAQIYAYSNHNYESAVMMTLDIIITIKMINESKNPHCQIIVIRKWHYHGSIPKSTASLIGLQFPFWVNFRYNILVWIKRKNIHDVTEDTACQPDKWFLIYSIIIAFWPRCVANRINYSKENRLCIFYFFLAHPTEQLISQGTNILWKLKIHWTFLQILKL